MSGRPVILDACCGQGGTGMGLHRAGFDVVGIDKDPQPHYPFEFYQGDAIEFIARYGRDFHAVAAGWPCQAFTRAQKIRGNTHPDLITPGREVMIATGRPWFIENVPGAPLRDPVELCGCMFPGLGVYRERWFEASWELPRMMHAEHVEPLTKMGRPPRDGERMHVVGNFSGADEARRRMGIDWMTRDGLREAIPPAYSEWVGRSLLDHLARAAA